MRGIGIWRAEVAFEPQLCRKASMPYLKARVSIREATLGGKREACARAEAELKAANQDALIGYVRAKSRPLDRLKRDAVEAGTRSARRLRL